MSDPPTAGGAGRSAGAVPVALAAAVQWPILARFFRTDDFLHLFDFANVGFAESVLRIHGGHLIVTHLAVFRALYQIFGDEPLPFMALTLATHLVSVALLYLATWRLSGSRALAVLGASLWGASPVALGTIGWFSVYGQALVAVLLLWILADVAAMAERGVAPRRADIARWLVLLFTMSLSFGIGIAMAVSFWAVLGLLLPPSPGRNRAVRTLAVLMLAVPAWYAAQTWIYDAAFPATVGPPSQESPALIGRGLVTRLADLLSYGSASVVAGPVLVTSGAGITSGPLRGAPPSQAMAIARGLAVILAGFVAIAVWRAPSDRRRRMAALLLLATTGYGAIAVARAIAFEAWIPRYQYVGPMLLGLLVCTAAREVLERWPYSPRWGRAAAALWLLGAVGLGVEASSNSDAIVGSDQRAIYTSATAELALAIERAEPGELVLRNRSVAVSPVLRRKTFFPGLAGVFLIAYSENTVEGRLIRFREPARAVVELARARPDSRLADLLVVDDTRGRRKRQRRRR